MQLFTLNHHGEAESARDLVVVVVPLLDLRLAGREVRADETDAGGVEEEADGHASFVASGPTHSSFDSVNSDISEGNKTKGQGLFFLATPVL